MTQQKSLKRRVRARMEKTGERYTAARRQVLAKGPAEPLAEHEPARAEPPVNPPTPRSDSTVWTTSDASMLKATGRSHAEWFALLDAWDATRHTHTETTEWLAAAHDAPSWWRQAITVDYQRARGMRRVHEMAQGFTVTVTRTISVPAAQALAAFADGSTLRAWFPDAPMEPSPTRARMTVRFDWSKGPSRVVVTSVPKGPDRALVAVSHERIPDAAAAARLKAEWRERLAALKAFLEDE